MIPEEIVGRRIPRSYGYRIPHSEFIEQADASLLDVNEYSSREISMNPSESVAINNTNPNESQGPEIEGNTQSARNWYPKLFPNHYTRPTIQPANYDIRRHQKIFVKQSCKSSQKFHYIGNRRRSTISSFSF